MYTCLKEHTISCRKPNGTFTPSRLLLIEETRGRRTIRLIYPTSYQPYAALSYCWGGHQELTLTSQTSLKLTAPSDVEELHPTIKDAVTVTINLGLHLLWVDALCIFQDDDGDKAKEIATMATIYNQAMVTIAASRARHVKEGFLQDRTYPEGTFELSYIGLDGRRTAIILQLGNDEPPDPLRSRGWALQERYLSARLLHFGTFRTSWDCVEGHSIPHPQRSDGYRPAL